MKLYSENESYKLYQGSMLDMLDVIHKESIDNIITDPPYELNFMGKGWDNSGIAFQPDAWRKCYEVLKPGGYLLAFGGSRTFHRIACAIEDAGFEIRDTIMWLYGSGFPKSMSLGKVIEGKQVLGSANVRDIKKLDGEKEIVGGGWNSNEVEQGKRKQEYEQTKTKVNYTTELGKKWQGWGTALKPSFEPIIVARKPFKGSLVDNVIEYGVGGINIDECRVGSEVIKGGTMPKMNSQSDGINLYNFGKHNAERLERQDNIGRFPANTILTYDETDFDEVCGGFPNTSGGKMKLNSEVKRKGMSADGSSFNSNTCGFDVNKGTGLCNYGDSGSASRYFYCAKASKKDRDEGLEEFEIKKTGELQGGRKEGSAGSIMQNANGGTRVNPYAGTGTPKRNTHPTVKPTSLMQYLVRLVSPNGATILDPFNGSGSTGKAVMYENYERNKDYKYIGIELTEEYLPISKARIEYVCNLKPEINPQMSIFDLEESR